MDALMIEVLAHTSSEVPILSCPPNVGAYPQPVENRPRLSDAAPLGGIGGLSCPLPLPPSDHWQR